MSLKLNLSSKENTDLTEFYQLCENLICQLRDVGEIPFNFHG